MNRPLFDKSTLSGLNDGALRYSWYRAYTVVSMFMMVVGSRCWRHEWHLVSEWCDRWCGSDQLHAHTPCPPVSHVASCSQLASTWPSSCVVNYRLDSFHAKCTCVHVKIWYRIDCFQPHIMCESRKYFRRRQSFFWKIFEFLHYWRFPNILKRLQFFYSPN